MAFTVLFFDGNSYTYPGGVKYEFLPNGVLACTTDQNHVAYYAPGHWKGVSTDDGHTPERMGYPGTFFHSN